MLSPTLPLTDASTTKQKKNIEEPTGWLKKLQGLFTIDRDNLLKTCQGPFGAVMRQSSGTIVGARVGVRYFIHSLDMSCRLINTDTTTDMECFYTVNGVDIYHLVCTVPSVAGVYSRSIVLDVLCDENSAINMAFGTAAPSVASVIVTCCEVPV